MQNAGLCYLSGIVLMQKRSIACYYVSFNNLAIALILFSMLFDSAGYLFTCPGASRIVCESQQPLDTYIYLSIYLYIDRSIDR